MDRLERPGRTDRRWKSALKGVAAAALRLHHYRFVRTRMLHDALASARDDVACSHAVDEPRT